MLPWPEMMCAALRVGVPVHRFWQLSLREWRWLADSARAQDLTPDDLTNLMKQFPDEGEEDE